jgi:hypothetical protein
MPLDLADLSGVFPDRLLRLGIVPDRPEQLIENDSHPPCEVFAIEPLDRGGARPSDLRGSGMVTSASSAAILCGTAFGLRRLPVGDSTKRLIGRFRRAGSS